MTDSNDFFIKCFNSPLKNQFVIDPFVNYFTEKSENYDNKFLFKSSLIKQPDNHDNTYLNLNSDFVPKQYGCKPNYDFKQEDLDLVKYTLSLNSNNDSESMINFNTDSCKCSISTVESDYDHKLENRKKRTLLNSDERQFIMFFNTFFKLKWEKHNYFKSFNKPSYKLFNNKLKNLTKRSELLNKSLPNIVLNESFYTKIEDITENHQILNNLETDKPDLFMEIKNTSIGSFITSDTIDEVLNSNEFLKKINRKSLNIISLTEKILLNLQNYVAG